MGNARKNYPDEDIARGIYSMLPTLMILLWANHSYQTKGTFDDEILENIQYLKERLQALADEIKKENK